MRLAFLLICACLAGPAQDLTIGVRSALRLTPEDDPYAHAESRPYRVGPSVRVGLPLGFAIEADALYSRLGDSSVIPLIGNEAVVRTRADAWEYPILAKYRAPVRRLRPEVFFGVAPRHASGRVDETGYRMVDISREAAYANVSRWRARDHAWIFGSGVEFGAGPLRLNSELLYFRRKVASSPSEWNIARHLPVPENAVAVSLTLGWRVRLFRK